MPLPAMGAILASLGSAAPAIGAAAGAAGLFKLSYDTIKSRVMKGRAERRRKQSLSPQQLQEEEQYERLYAEWKQVKDSIDKIERRRQKIQKKQAALDAQIIAQGGTPTNRQLAKQGMMRSELSNLGGQLNKMAEGHLKANNVPFNASSSDSAAGQDANQAPLDAFNQSRPNIPATLAVDPNQAGSVNAGASENGQQDSLQTFNRYSPDQQNAMNTLLRSAMGQLSSNKFDFGPIENIARRDFKENTIPTIAERFSQLNAQKSSAFPMALGRAGRELEENLAGQRQDYNLRQQDQAIRLLEAGLNPQFDSLYRQGGPQNNEGFFKSLGKDALRSAVANADLVGGAKELINYGLGQYRKKRDDSASYALEQSQRQAAANAPDPVFGGLGSQSMPTGRRNAMNAVYGL